MDPIVMSKRGLIRPRNNPSQLINQPHLINRPLNITTDFDVSFAMGPGEMRRFLNESSLPPNGSSFESTNFLSDSCRDLDTHDTENSTNKEKTNMLFPQFFEILQNRSNQVEIFDTIQDLIHICSSVLEEINTDNNKKKGEQQKMFLDDPSWLQQERDTWKLLHAIYKDRIIVQKEVNDYDVLLSGSEKEVIEQLYAANSNLREYQLVVDWLESCSADQNFVDMSHYTDRTVAWENTLWQLLNPGAVAFGSSCDVVQQLDPDAPYRENKRLHPLDVEDNERLTRNVFMKIRQGAIDDAKLLCTHCGQPWRAAILEGWRLFDDPNYDNDNVHEKASIEGNPRRDLWKMCAWMMADCPKYDVYSRAICGALSGHLDSLLEVSEDSWLNLLWSYLKVQIDIRVETEMRSSCIKNYIEMPPKYWNSKMTLDQIFDELAVHKNLEIRNEAKHKIHVIQKLIILDNSEELLDFMKFWIEEEKLSAHMLRFLSHIVLFLRHIHRPVKTSIADDIIKEYCESLITLGDPQLIAFYTAALSSKLQIIIYAKYLEGVTATKARNAALTEAVAAGLDIDRITSYTVKVIRNHQGHPNDDKVLKTEISKTDAIKISGLEYLTFYPQHKGELLWQANGTIRKFLAEGKIECVRHVFKIIPQESVEEILSIYGGVDNLPCRDECSIKEYLCYQTYITAIDGFNDWTHLYHSQPKTPEPLKGLVSFTEKIAQQHKEQSYKIEYSRWQNNLMEQTKISRDLLYNILLFPEKGWLIDPDTTKEPIDTDVNDWEIREIQLTNLRKLCIPEIILLLHKVLHLSGSYQDCVRLVDDIASEKLQLYQVYPKHKLAEIIAKICESSLALMNKRLDPWGYKINI